MSQFEQDEEGMHLLDARGLLCPLPVIRTQDRLGKLAAGEKLKVLCTDPGTLQDIPSWCRVHGHRLLSTNEAQREIELVIEKV